MGGGLYIHVAPGLVVDIIINFDTINRNRVASTSCPGSNIAGESLGIVSLVTRL